MPAVVWMRNPDLYIRECVEEMTINLAWDIGRLVKRTIDPVAYADLYFPPTVDHRTMVIGNSDQGADIYRRGDTFGRPAQTVPVWCYGDSLPILEELMDSCSFVVVSDLPRVNEPGGKMFIRTLRDLQEEYPECIVHVHGLYSYRVMFGLGFRSVDVDPRTCASKGSVTLPVGREVTFERAAELPHWVNLMGMNTGDLHVPRNRCIYNMRSAHWAARHFTENVKFKYKTTKILITEEEFAARLWEPPASQRIQITNKKPLAGDKFLCDMCSLQLSCRYFRSGSVCAVPDSEPAELARFFKTRDSDTIIEGLGTLLAANTRRLERGMEDEDVAGKLDPEVTKIFKHIFDQGVKLAKLVNPALASAAAPKFNFNQMTINASNPSELMAAAVAELEARGVRRESITPEMIESLLGAKEPVVARAIEMGRDA